jgi:hypothetical protein
VYSQELKTYKGEFQGTNTTGIIDYQYYENSEYKRIYNGYFKFNSVVNTYGFNLSIIGQYKENMKNGNWSYKLSSTPSLEYKNLTSTIVGAYSEGNLTGPWVFKRNATKNIRGMGGSLIGTSILTDFSSCNFTNNTFTGAFKYNVGDIKVSGNFDTNGFMDGEWKTEWTLDAIPYQEIRQYKNGFCSKALYRNLATGEILYSIDKSSIYNSLTTDSLTNQTVIIDGKKYKIELIDKTEVDDVIFHNINNTENEGISRLYLALGFWICCSSADCHFFMSEETVQFVRGNYLYEIDYGINPVKFQFEKKLTPIN